MDVGTKSQMGEIVTTELTPKMESEKETNVNFLCSLEETDYLRGRDIISGGIGDPLQEPHIYYVFLLTKIHFEH